MGAEEAAWASSAPPFPGGPPRCPGISQESRFLPRGQLHFEHGGQLWRLLETVTRHKILKHAEYQKAKKRTPKAEEYPDVEKLFARKPTAEQQAIAKELVAKILDGLDQTYRKILLLMAEGHSERAVAEQLGCTRRAVAAKVDRLRKRLQRLWEEDAGHDRVE